MSQRQNAQLGIRLVKRKRRVTSESPKQKTSNQVKTPSQVKTPKAPTQVKTPTQVKRSKICIVEDADVTPSVSFHSILQDCAKAFQTQGVRDIVCSFFDYEDAIRFCVRNVLVAQIALRLDINREFFDNDGFPGKLEKWEVEANMTAFTERDSVDLLTGQDDSFQFFDHESFADAFLAYAMIRPAMKYGSVICIKWILELQQSYWTKTLHKSSSLPTRMRNVLTECVRYTIREDRLAHFQWLLELVNLPFDSRFLTEAILRDHCLFVEHLLFKYRFKKSIVYTGCVRSIPMMELLWKHHFPFNGRLTNKFIQQGDMPKVNWLLGQGVKERDTRDTRETSNAMDLGSGENSEIEHMPYLECAIRAKSYPAIERLADYEYKCSSALVEMTILNHDLKAMEILFRRFFSHRRMAFDNFDKHEAFLLAFIEKLQSIDFSIYNNPDYELSVVLRWMNQYRPNDLSDSLLFSRAIRHQTTDAANAKEMLDFLYGIEIRGLNVNHMDEAILYSSDAICEWLLSKQIPCSQLGMDQLVDFATSDNSSGWRWKRIERLLHHPLCAHLRLQKLWPDIESGMPTEHTFSLVPVALPEPMQIVRA